MKDKLKDSDILNIIIHLISSSRLIIEEPKEYAPIRLFSAACYLSKFLKDSEDKNIKNISNRIIHLDTVISRDFFNKPDDLKRCLDNLSEYITKQIR